MRFAIARQVCAGAVVAAVCQGLPALGALLYTSPSGTVRTNADNYSIGMRFVVGSTPIVVTSLGVWDQNGDGLLAAHDVGLWNDAGGAPLATATVPIGTSGTLVGGVFRFAPDLATPLTLAANTTYRLADLEISAEPFLEQGASATYTGYVSGTPVACYGGGGSPVLTFPGAAGGGVNGYLGPNLQFIVPEPASAFLFAAGILRLAARPRRAHGSAAGWQ